MPNHITILLFRMHASLSSASSQDATFFWEFSGHHSAEVNQPIGFGPDPDRLICDVYQDDLATLIFLDNDTTFQKGKFGQSFGQTPTFLSKVQGYCDQGWQSGYPPQAQDFWTREGKRKAKEAKKLGYINWRIHQSEPTPQEELKGGFSPKITETEKFQNYTKSGFCFGWIGHSYRTAELDRELEKALKATNLSAEGIAGWITSTDGRHFMDYLEDKPLNLQTKLIQENAAHIHNKAIVYASTRHQGTLKSTLEIQDDYRQRGILKPTSPTVYYS